MEIMRILKRAAGLVATLVLAVACGSGGSAAALSDDDYKLAMSKNDTIGVVLNKAGAQAIRFTAGVEYSFDGDPYCRPQDGEKARAKCPINGTIEFPRVIRGFAAADAPAVPTASPSPTVKPAFELGSFLEVRGTDQGTWGHSISCVWVETSNLTVPGVLNVANKALDAVPLTAADRQQVEGDDGDYWMCKHVYLQSPAPSHR